jgi:predicted metal-dependent hydrolase
MTANETLPRYCLARELPPYSYVPGKGLPHPVGDERGHSFGRHDPPAVPLAEKSWRENETWLYAIDLFNHGYYWEAHEAWESLWHAARRSGPTADLLKGLIKLAAAGVKSREDRPRGVAQHARRAAELLEAASSQLGDSPYGLALADVRSEALQIAASSRFEPLRLRLRML